MFKQSTNILWIIIYLLIDLVKLDVEGSELDIMKGFKHNIVKNIL